VCCCVFQFVKRAYSAACSVFVFPAQERECEPLAQLDCPRVSLLAEEDAESDEELEGKQAEDLDFVLGDDEDIELADIEPEENSSMRSSGRRRFNPTARMLDCWEQEEMDFDEF
jgi:hypothetical protein